MGMSPLDEWLLWHILWRANAGPERLFVKFEKLKTQPCHEFQQLLSWLGESATETQILEAVARSSFKLAKSSDPNGNVMSFGKLEDYKLHLQPEELTHIEKQCVALYEKEEIPQRATDVLASVNLLQERFGRLGSGEFETMLYNENIYDLKKAIKSQKKNTYSDSLLLNAIYKTERLMTSPVFSNLMNLMDPNVKIALASLLFVISKTEYPELISSRSFVKRMARKRTILSRSLVQRVKGIF